MPDKTIHIEVTGDSSKLSSALNTGAASVEKFTTVVGTTTPSLNAGEAAEESFASVLKGLWDTVTGFTSSVGKAPPKLDEVSESLHKATGHTAEFEDVLKRAEKSAEFREVQLAIREGIENPLGAAKKAAEG